MDIFVVNIYIETSLKGPALRQGAGKWIVEFIRGNGNPETREGILCKEKTTENALALELIRDALSILTKTCSVRVNTQCEHVLNTMRNYWLPQWEKNGWINARGKPVKNAELWQQCSEQFRKHCVEFVSGPHSYRNVMQEDIRREMERRAKNVR